MRLSTSARLGKDIVPDKNDQEGKSASHSFSWSRDIWTIPNVLSFTRLAATPYIGYCIVTEQYDWAFGLFVASGLTDMLDGWLARRFDMGSFVGSLLDPLADKTLMTVVTVCLAYQELIPVPLAGLILGRDVGLIIATIVYRYRMLSPPITITKFFDVSHQSVEVTPTTISKANTALQLLLLSSALAGPVFPALLTYPHLMTGLQYTVGATTILSGLSYITAKDVVKPLVAPKKDGKAK